MTVRKAVVPAAGWGTRFLPASKGVPKELMPLIDRPAIQYTVEEAVAAGVREIVLVTSKGKEAIEAYFKPAPELERYLEAKGDRQRLREVQSLAKLAKVRSVLQPEQRGLGHAVLMAKDAVGGEFFAVVLPDDVIDAPVPVLKQLLDVHARTRASVVAVQRVPREQISRYGIIDGEPAGPRTYKLRRLVEKPKLSQAPSDLAIIGRYVLSPRVFDMLERVRPGAIGEIQLTDGIAALLAEESVYACEYEGELLDAGTPLGLLKASVRLALKRPDLAPEFRRWLKEQAQG